MERCKINEKNVKDDDELEVLLNEIPHATSSHHHQYHSSNIHHVLNGDHHGFNGDACGVSIGGDGNGNGNGSVVMQGRHGNGMYGMYDDDSTLSRCNFNHPSGSSPVNGFCLQSSGSSSSLFSGGHSLSENGSITPPPVEELKTYMPFGGYNQSSGLRFDSETPGCVDEEGLCRDMNKMYIGNRDEDSMIRYGCPVFDQSKFELTETDGDKFVPLGKLRKGFTGFEGVQSSVAKCLTKPRGEMNPTLLGLQASRRMVNSLEPPFPPCRPDALFSQLNNQNGPLSVPWQRTSQQENQYYRTATSLMNLKPSTGRVSAADALFYARQNGVVLNEEKGLWDMGNHPHIHQARAQYMMNHPADYGVQNWGSRQSSNIVIPPGKFEALPADISVIIQGECSNQRCENKGSFRGIGMGKHADKRSLASVQPQTAGVFENGRSGRTYNSLEEVRGYIYLMAKDQNGCRFLQNLFDKGNPLNVEIIFSEISGHVVELMMDQFGNYLIQKFLEVCSEEQRMQIVLIVTKKPGELVRVSLNAYGTRVVQKLIETLGTRQQISLIITALEPGFLVLIKDLNGNHVVQRCLQCFDYDDKRFIFVGAARHCVEIARHQHGCCVLQRCISYSMDVHRENLVTEISANGLLLAQDPYGNYVVQFVLDLKIPSATSNFLAQFEGNYVHLSTQKCGSHVVERCLAVFDDKNRYRIIHELLSSAVFGALLQDPYANYVIHKALLVSQGSVYKMLVEAIEPHRAILCNSPYSKKIYSLLWKK